MSDPAPIFVTCDRCGQLLTLTGDDARDWRPGASVTHAVCPSEAQPPQFTYELDLVLRARPAETEPGSETELLARVTKRVDAASAPDALNQLLHHTNDLWEQLVELSPLADVEWRTELAAERVADPEPGR